MPVIPLICWALTVVVHLLMLGTSTAILAAQDQSATRLWSEARFLPDTFALLYHLVVLHGLAAAHDSVRRAADLAVRRR